MFNKVLRIAWTNIYITYTDRGAVVIMLLIPVLLSSLISLAFGEGVEDVNLEAAKLGIINQDAGHQDAFGNAQNWGALYAEILATAPPEGIADLIAGQVLEISPEAARAQVAAGELDALLILGPDFTAQAMDGGPSAALELVYNPGDSIKVTIVLSVVESITAQLNRGQVGTQVLLGEGPLPAPGQEAPYLIDRALQSGQVAQIEAAANAAISQLYSNDLGGGIRLNSLTLSGESETFDPLKYFAPSMAVLFLSFSAAAGAKSILEESRNGTLQRIMTTPTPRWAFMAGKMLGVFGSGVLQMALLILTMPFIASLLGRDPNVWGENIPGIIITVAAAVGATTGLGLLIAAFSQSPRQADNIANAVLVVLAMMGGTFVPVENVPVLDALSRFSLNYWSVEAFTQLSGGLDDAKGLFLAWGALFLMTAVFFGGALVGFGRRLDI
jgi:ABC-2 type transport system permease protein